MIPRTPTRLLLPLRARYALHSPVVFGAPAWNSSDKRHGSEQHAMNRWPIRDHIADPAWDSSHWPPPGSAAMPWNGSAVKKVLIVEDQEDILEIIRITLELDNFELHSASDGEAGLRMAAQIKPDLILSDVMMPRMDGLQLCRRIRADPALRRTKLILLSARAQAEDRRAGQAAGADAYLTKPYSPLQLLETVQQVLR